MNQHPEDDDIDWTEPGVVDSSDEACSVVRELYYKELRSWLRRVRNSDNPMAGCGHVPRYDGGIDPHDGKKFKPVWPKLVKFLRDNFLDPEKYFKKVFYQYTGDRAPNPHYLCSQKALKEFLSCTSVGADRLVKECADGLEDEMRLIKTEILLRIGYVKRIGISWADVLRSVLESGYLPISALVRYHVAYEAGFDDLLESFYDAARRQYLTKPEIYDAAWGERIPEIIRG